MRYLELRSFFVLVFVISAMAYSTVAQSKQGQLTGQDKKQILKAILVDAESRFHANPDLRKAFSSCQTLTLKNKRVVFLSTENIERKFVPKIAGVHLELMNNDEINTEVETNGHLCYLMFRGFTQNKGKVAVNLDRVELTTGGCKGCLKGYYATSTRYICQKLRKWQVKYKGSVEMVN